LDTHVIRTRGAAADADPMAMSNPSVVSSSARNCQIQIGAFQFLYRRSGIVSKPMIQDLDDACLQNGRFENAAVKENRRRMNERLSFGNSRLTGQESSQVPRDARILRIG